MASGLENEYVTLHEIVKAAKVRLNGNIWDYLIGGTETETTLRRNRMALDSIAFKPRVLRNVGNIDPSSEIFGRKLRIPVLLAPVGSLESFEPGGGITVAKGAGAGSVGMLISSVTTNGWPSGSSRRWARATTPSASPSTRRCTRAASATSPSASSSRGAPRRPARTI